MNEITTCDLPSSSTLHARIGPSDFLDCYAVASDLPTREAADIIVQFPGWVRLLMLIRRVVTTPFGLANDAPAHVDRIGIFPVETDSAHELIAGFDDKHLEFRISVIGEEGRVYLATWVHPHNIAGRAYLAAIMPFHIAISRNALVRVGNAAVRPASG